MSYKSVFLAGLIIGIGNSIIFDEEDCRTKKEIKKKLYKFFISNGLGTAITFTGFIYGMNIWGKIIDLENRKLQIDKF